MSIFIPAIQKLNLNPIFSIFTPAIQNFTKAQIFHIYPCYSICKKAQKHRFTLVFLLLLQMLSFTLTNSGRVWRGTGETDQQTEAQQQPLLLHYSLLLDRSFKATVETDLETVLHLTFSLLFDWSFKTTLFNSLVG